MPATATSCRAPSLACHPRSAYTTSQRSIASRQRRMISPRSVPSSMPGGTTSCGMTTSSPLRSSIARARSKATTLRASWPLTGPET